MLKKLMNILMRFQKTSFIIVSGLLLFVFSNLFTATKSQNLLIENDTYSRFDGNKNSAIINLKGKRKPFIAIQVFPTPGSHNTSKWQIIRHYPSGKLEVNYKNKVDFKPIALPIGFSLDSYLMLAIGDINAPYLLIYDVTRNIPSGRKLVVEEPGYDLYQMKPTPEPHLQLIAQGINIGGIDSLVYGHQVGSEIVLCANKECMSILSNGDKIKWNLENLNQYEFIEVKFHKKDVYALVRLHHEDRSDGKLQDKNTKISLAKLSKNQPAEITEINASGIPFNLNINNSDKPVWDIANSIESLRTLLFFDLGRMLHHGWIDFGANNFEGRVAWSQVYYLNGLLSLLDNESGLQYISTDKVRDQIYQTTLEELELLASLAEYDYPGYRVKRYSIDREPLLFALHLGRIVNLLNKALSVYKNNEKIKSAIPIICKELNKLNHTVEGIENTKQSTITLNYRSGYPFWADGANVPYNYISGYIEGLVTACTSNKNIRVSTLLIQSLLSNIEKNPSIWRYWGGIGDNGWLFGDRISINTPEWQGNKHTKAHITYRSMDALAILALYRVNPNLLNSTHNFLNNIQSLVISGLLLPDVNQSLYLSKIAVSLNHITAKYYARSTTAWEISSQIWALEALAKISVKDND